MACIEFLLIEAESFKEAVERSQQPLWLVLSFYIHRIDGVPFPFGAVSTAALACIEFLQSICKIIILQSGCVSTAAWACIEFLHCHCYERLTNNSRESQQPLGLVLSFYNK